MTGLCFLDDQIDGLAVSVFFYYLVNFRLVGILGNHQLKLFGWLLFVLQSHKINRFSFDVLEIPQRFEFVSDKEMLKTF